MRFHGGATSLPDGLDRVVPRVCEEAAGADAGQPRPLLTEAAHTGSQYTIPKSGLY